MHIHDEYDDASDSPPPTTTPPFNPYSLTLPSGPSAYPSDCPSVSLPTTPIHPSDFALSTSSEDEHDGYDYYDEADDDEDDENYSADDDSQAFNYFVHNGYRYDGDIFQLRPPQERSIASRPERILEHKPPLLNNRQVFNRVYSEGTYNSRPLSLRQPARNSGRYSTSSLASSEDTDQPPASPMHIQPLQIDAAGIPAPPPRPVTRPGSIRPPASSSSPGRFCRTIEAVRLSATEGKAHHNLHGSLAYSQVPVTRISGGKPELLSSSGANVVTTRGVVEVRKGDSGEKRGEENLQPVKERRGKSYTVANKYPLGAGGQRKSSFWRGRLLSR